MIFAVSRGLAEVKGEPWYLGVVGAGLSLSAGVGSILGGWLAHRLDGPVVSLRIELGGRTRSNQSRRTHSYRSRNLVSTDNGSSRANRFGRGSARK